ncbi:MAG: biotin transporter BioY [Nanoarchaeota archaeon]
MESAIKHKTLYEMIFRQKNIVLEVFMVIFSVMFMAVLANIRIPIWPVPVTMQTFGVFTLAFFFGSKKGFLSVLSYILAGIVGFSVFTGYKSGMAIFLGPTGGYLIGFLFMAFFVGTMIEKGFGRTKKSVLLCMMIGSVILYSFGLTGLWFFLGKVSVWKVLVAGLFPFLIGDAIKIGLAVGLFPYLWKGSERLSS